MIFPGVSRNNLIAAITGMEKGPLKINLRALRVSVVNTAFSSAEDYFHLRGNAVPEESPAKSSLCASVSLW